MTSGRYPRRNRPKAPWGQSATFRAIGRSAIKAYNAERHLLPKCGARSRTTGDPCQNPGMENGRCRLHGGATPKGENWHRKQWPADEAKLGRKLRDAERQARIRAKRIAAMTPEERHRYDAWLRAHQPGRSGTRALDRAWREGDAYLRQLVAAADPPRVSPEAAALQRLIDAKKDEIARLEGIVRSHPPTGSVFE